MCESTKVSVIGRHGKSRRETDPSKEIGGRRHRTMLLPICFAHLGRLDSATIVPISSMRK
jgi:hypothetical protein